MKAALLALLLAGCSSMPEGVKMTPEEAIACKRDTCSVWTPDELTTLVKAAIDRAYKAGFSAGQKHERGTI
jgi:starvation-inducible outer membrane lipoprotein